MTLAARIQDRKPQPKPEPRVPEWLRRQNERLARLGRVAEKELVA